MPPPKKWLRKLKVTRVDLVPRGDNPDAHIALAKAHPEETTVPPTLPADLAALDQATFDGVLAFLKEASEQAAAALPYLEAHRTEKAAADAEVTKLTKERDDAVAKANGEETPAPIDKSALSPELLAIVEKAEADSAEVAALRKERRADQFTTVAKALPRLHGKPDELGAILEAAEAELPAETYKELERILVAADDKIAKGDLFKEIGGPGGPGAAEAKTKVDTLADELMKSDGDLSKPEAVAKVLDQHPELYGEYTADVAEATA